MAQRIKDKRVIVWGAGSIGPGWGNGKAAAVLYAREGAKVLAFDQNADAAFETVDLIRQEGGVAEAYQGDVTDEESVKAAVSKVVDLWGGLDIVHFNVGMSRPGGAIECKLDDWSYVFKVNLDSALLVSRAALPVMLRQGKGSFVFISSMAAVLASNYAYISYEASKAALNRLSMSIAMEYASQGVRSNIVMPGPIDTPHVKAYIAGKVADDKDLDAQRAAMVPLGRQGSAWDIAHAAVFLASDDADFITGVELPVDGGMSRKLTPRP